MKLIDKRNIELIQRFDDTDFILKEFIKFVYQLSNNHEYNWYKCGIKDDMIFEAIYNCTIIRNNSEIPNYRKIDLSRKNVLAYWRVMIENSFRKVQNDFWKRHQFKKDYYTINFETSYLEPNNNMEIGEY